MAKAKATTAANLGFEATLWATADKLRTNMDTAEYKHAVVCLSTLEELVKSLKAGLKVDWKQWESVRAQIRIAIKRILTHYKYPPDKQAKAVQTVIEQAEELYGEWVA